MYRKDEVRMLMLFGQRDAQIRSLLQSLVQSISGSVMIIDVHHTWVSDTLTGKSHIIQPSDPDNLMDSLLQLPLFITPKFELIIADNLPLFFRDYYSDSSLQLRNKRIFAASLALLNKLSSSTRVLITSYTQGVDVNEPFSPEISNFYCDDIVQVKNTVSGFSMTSKRYNWEASIT